MAYHLIKKGLDLPILGAPTADAVSAPACSAVALMGGDYVGMRPRLAVHVGDSVRRGQLLFEDRKSEGVRYTAPAAGTVRAIHRGEKRAFVSLVIELSAAEQHDSSPREALQRSFDAYRGAAIGDLCRSDVVALLVESGLWTALRTRPFGRVPSPQAAAPASIFVTAMDTEPLAPPMHTLVEGRGADLAAGLATLSCLAESHTWLCKPAGVDLGQGEVPGVTVEEFSGPHPAGTVGLHIHRLDPVCRDRAAWHIGLQDVLAIGVLFRTGLYDPRRLVSFAGPLVERPRLLQTRLGAALDPLVAGELREGEARVISGSVLSGRTAMGETSGYLGRYHQQISVLAEGRERHFMGWAGPGKKRFSLLPVFLSRLLGPKRFGFTTTTNGGERAMVPIGMYERVMPYDIMPTFLLRALLADDLEQAIDLGCLELVEEDLALCSFVCPSKIDYPSALRRMLDRIEREA